jgi:hypothetical protein
MPHFDLCKCPPSTRVTRQLVNSLENYVAKKKAALATNPDEKGGGWQWSQKTTIVDDLGSEPLSSIDEHTLPLFSDTTTSVKVRLSGTHMSSPSELILEVDLSKERSKCGIRISYDGPNAREVVVGLYDGIKRCLGTSPAHNALVHPPLGGQLAILLLIQAPFSAALASLFLSRADVAYPFLALGLVLLLLWLVIPRIRPYTVFDSDRANRYARAWDWFVKGFLTLLIFGTLLTLMGEKLFQWLFGTS